jgi:hypothetical protein
LEAPIIVDRLFDEITAMLKPTRGGHWTYADYCGWPDDERWELIDGVAYATGIVWKQERWKMW